MYTGGELIKIIKHILLNNGFEHINNHIFVGVSKKYKHCEAIIDNNDMFIVKIYNPIESKSNLVKIGNIISHFTPGIIRGDLDPKQFEKILMDYIQTSVDGVINTYDNLKEFPKNSEYEYIFGELLDLKYTISVSFGYYNDEEATSNPKTFKDRDNIFFKVLIELYYTTEPTDNEEEDEDKTQRDIQFYEESESEIEHCMQRLKSFQNIKSSYEIEADEFMSHEYIKIMVHLLKND